MRCNKFIDNLNKIHICLKIIKKYSFIYFSFHFYILDGTIWFYFHSHILKRRWPEIYCGRPAWTLWSTDESPTNWATDTDKHFPAQILVINVNSTKMAPNSTEFSVLFEIQIFFSHYEKMAQQISSQIRPFWWPPVLAQINNYIKKIP